MTSALIPPKFITYVYQWPSVCKGMTVNYYFDKWNKKQTETIFASLDIFLKLTEYVRLFFMIHVWTSLCVMHGMKKSKTVLTLVWSGFNSFIKIMLAVTTATSKGQQNISKPSRDCAAKYWITKHSMDSVQIHWFLSW